MLQGWTEISVSLSEFPGPLSHKFLAQRCNVFTGENRGKAVSQKLEKCKGGSLPPGLCLTQSQSLAFHLGKRLPWPMCTAVAAGKCPHAFAYTGRGSAAAGEELLLWQHRRWEQCTSAPFRVWLCFPPGRGVRWAEQLCCGPGRTGGKEQRTKSSKLRFTLEQGLP